MGMPKKYYDSETGDICEQGGGEEVVAMEPLRVPGIIEQFMNTYIPAPDERHADVVMNLGAFRDEVVGWVAYGVKEDPVSEYLEQLAGYGYTMQQTCSGPAFCLMYRTNTVQTNGWTAAEEVDNFDE